MSECRTFLFSGGRRSKASTTKLSNGVLHQTPALRDNRLYYTCPAGDSPGRTPMVTLQLW